MKGLKTQADRVEDLERAYDALAAEIAAEVVPRINHLLIYARVEKNQNWLHPLANRDLFGPLHRVTHDGVKWQYFDPASRHHAVSLVLYPDRGLTRVD